MPRVRCTNCNTYWSLSSEEFGKLLDFRLPVCSQECLLDFIKRQPASQEARQYNSYTSEGRGEFWSALLKRYFISSYEVAIAEWLHAKDILFYFESFFFEVGTTIYVPDFYIPTYDLFIEVKGAWGMGAKSKVNSFLKIYPDVRFVYVPWFIPEALIEQEIISN